MANAPFYQPGRYVGEVIDQALGKASTGNPQFVLKIKVLGTPDPKEPGNYIIAAQQYDRHIYRTLTEKTMPYVLEDLKTLGFTGDSFRYLDPNVSGAQSFVGGVFDFFCTHEKEQNGDGMREKWGIARQGGGKLEVEALDSAAVRQLDALFGKQLKAQAGTPKPVKPAAPVAAGMISDDDVPF